MANRLPTRANAFLQFSWAGEEQLIRNLSMLDSAMPQIVRPALHSGATLIAKAAQRHAEPSRDTGTLEASIGVKVWSDRNQTNLVAYIGPRRRRGRMITGPRAGQSSYDKEAKRHVRSGGRQRIPTRYAHFVEDEIHFMKRAADEAGPVARFRVIVMLWKGIERVVARMPKVRPVSR